MEFNKDTRMVCLLIEEIRQCDGKEHLEEYQSELAIKACKMIPDLSNDLTYVLVTQTRDCGKVADIYRHNRVVWEKILAIGATVKTIMKGGKK